LAIIGLLVGGVLVGQTLIKAAQIRNTTAEIDSVRAAVYTFRNKFNATPGDIQRADMFGLDRSTPSGLQNVALTANSNFNGNGDGILNHAANSQHFDGEVANFWVHLSNAGLIKHTLSQTAGCNGIGASKCNAFAGQGFPRTPVGVGLIVVHGVDSSLAPDGIMPNGYFLLGMSNTDISDLSNVGFGPPFGTHTSMTPEEARIIDIKLDDGLPKSGEIASVYRLNCASPSPFCQPTGFFGYDAVGDNLCYTSYTTPVIYTRDITPDVMVAGSSTTVCMLAIRARF
jgi:hypothetical protein